MDRILLNIISNALKFTEQGFVKLSTELIAREENSACIQFIIQDSGIGIAEDKIDKIFNRFYKITPSYHTQHVGYGIGLFIVKKFVTLLGGEITVQSKLGEGTKFRVTVPVKIGTEEQAKLIEDTPLETPAFRTRNQVSVTHDKTLTSGKKKGKVKVLFVEDDSIARRTGTFFLEDAGCDVDAVANGEEGYKHIKAGVFDLAITDIGLPGIDGTELASLIRNWEEKNHMKPIPIIGLSAHTSGEMKAEASRVGMTDMLQKPINAHKVDTILKFLSDTKKSEIRTEVNDISSSSLGFDLPETEAQLFELEHFSLFDEEEGLNATDHDAKMLQEILAMLVDSTLPEEIINLERAHTERNWEELQKIGHKLKGATLYCGAIKMRYASQYFERYLLAKRTKLKEELYQQFVKVLNETSLAIRNYLDRTQ